MASHYARMYDDGFFTTPTDVTFEIDSVKMEEMLMLFVFSLLS